MTVEAHDDDDDFQCQIEYETILPGTTPAEAFDAFKRVVWWGGGGLGATGVVSAGDSKTLKGSVRSVPLGIHEAVLSSSYPDAFEYTVVQKSVLPVSAHRGCLMFQPLGGDGDGDVKATRVVWHVMYTPYNCMNWLAKIMMAFLPLFLRNLHDSVVKDQNTSHSSKPKAD
mmetsp:Transcript_15035/g.28286  ORF Transcript_15035/g.28286 Transcript_15035/m.28286 type:complete len:170 (-) Transcript_15035:847-1356(-)